MKAKSTREQYGSAAVILHWLSVVAVPIALVLGFLTAGTTDPMRKSELLRLHALVGLMAASLMMLRAGWWLFVDRRPDVPNATAWRRVVARSTHNLLYVTIIGGAALGVLMVVHSGVYVWLFSAKGSDSLPDFWNLPWRLPHGIAARLTILLLLIHLVGTLVRTMTTRGRFLRRMWF